MIAQNKQEMTNAKSKFSELPMTLTFKPTFLRPMESSKTMAMDGADYPYVSKCRKKSRDLQQTLSAGISDGPWNDNELCEGQYEDSSRCSDYSSCSDLCSSPESSTDGYHAIRSSFNTLPNHHDLLSPFAPFVRNGQYDNRKTTSDRASHRNNTAFNSSGIDNHVSFSLSVDDSDSSEISTFEVAYKRLVVDYPGDSGQDDQKYFHPIKEGSYGECGGVRKIPSKDAEKTFSLPDFLPKNDRCQLKSTITSSAGLRAKGSGSRLDVAQSMTDLFSKDTSCDLIRRYIFHALIEF